MECFERLKLEFEKNANPEKAKPMAAYMKHHFDFLGLKSPIRRELQKSFMKEASKLSWDDFAALIQLL